MSWSNLASQSNGTEKTILIQRGGNTDEMYNRPISLLSTIFKLFSRVLASKLTEVALNNQWLSAEQKGFLPGVREIQEYTQLLQTVVDNAQRNKTGFSITWLDLTNEFGSLPHAFMQQLFSSLTIPTRLNNILNDTYAENICNFQWHLYSYPYNSLSTARRCPQRYCLKSLGWASGEVNVTKFNMKKVKEKGIGSTTNWIRNTKFTFINFHW